MSHAAGGPLTNYNSLLDKNLSGYFANTRIRKHLVKSGLITRNGEITNGNAYRLKVAKKEHREHVRDLLANAIVEKALDMERMRQHEIRKKLDELYKIELVQKVRTERSLKTSEELYALLSPRSRKQRKHRTVKSAAVIGSDKSQTKLPDIHFDERTKRLTYESGSTIDSDSSSRFIVTQPKANRSNRHSRSKSATTATSFGKTPHPPPPKMKKKKKRKIHRGLMLARSEQLVAHRVQVQSMAEVTMKFLGSALQLTNDMFPANKLSEVQVIQQHCGGNTVCVFRELLPPNTVFTFVSRRHRGSPFGLTINIDGIKNIRVSSCCEYKHKPGYRIGGKNSQFGLIAVQGASPCYRCQVRLNLIDKKEEDLEKEFSSDEEEATRSFDIIVSRGGKREEVQRPVSANATTQTDEESAKEKRGVKLLRAEKADEYQDDFYEDEEEEGDGHGINEDMSSSASSDSDDSNDEEEESGDENQKVSNENESESESDSENEVAEEKRRREDEKVEDDEDREDTRSVAGKDEIKISQDSVTDDVATSDLEKSSDLDKSSDAGSSKSESETEDKSAASASDGNSDGQKVTEADHVNITEEPENRKSDDESTHSESDGDSDNETKAIRSGSSSSSASSDEEDEKDDVKKSDDDKNEDVKSADDGEKSDAGKNDDGKTSDDEQNDDQQNFDGKEEDNDDRETVSSMTIAIEETQNSDVGVEAEDDDRESFEREGIPSAVSRESTTLTGNEDGRCESENKTIQFNEEVDVVHYEKVDDESAVENTPRSDEDDDGFDSDDFDTVHKRAGGEHVLLADLGDDDDDDVDIQAELMAVDTMKENEEEEKRSEKEENVIVESDLDHRFYDKGHAPDEDLDDPDNSVGERMVHKEPIKTLIDDVENIDLVNSSLTKEQTDELLDILRENKSTVKSLSLRNSSVEKGGNMEVLKEIIKEMENLVELNLNDNGMTDEDCMHLADIITKGHTKLNSIVLHGNPFGDEGLQILLKALQNVPHLKTLDVGRCEISDDGAETILDYLMNNNNSLVELTLSYNDFSKEGWLYISSALKCNHGLQTLSIDNNNIGDEELAVLCQGISQNKSLRCLDIDGNVFSDVGGEHLFTAVERCETIVDVTLQPCPKLSSAVEERIRELINERVSGLT